MHGSTVWVAAVAHRAISDLASRILDAGGYSVGDCRVVGYSMGGYSVVGYSGRSTDFGFDAWDIRCGRLQRGRLQCGRLQKPSHRFRIRHSGYSQRETTVWEATVAQPPLSDLALRVLAARGYSVGGYNVGSYSVRD